MSYIQRASNHVPGEILEALLRQLEDARGALDDLDRITAQRRSPSNFELLTWIAVLAHCITTVLFCVYYFLQKDAEKTLRIYTPQHLCCFLFLTASLFIINKISPNPILIVPTARRHASAFFVKSYNNLRRACGIQDPAEGEMPQNGQQHVHID